MPRAALFLAVLLLAVPGYAAGGPDLALDVQTLQADLSLDLLTFQPNACELQPIDLCVGGPGARKLLRFSVFVVNRGDADVVLGFASADKLLPGTDQPEWTFSQCHNHWHFKSFARYELRLHGAASALVTGQKRSFCVEDTKAATSASPRKYCCAVGATCINTGEQGIQVGWGDLYPSNLPCQWIDVTDVAPGDYDLCVFIDTAALAAASGLQDTDPSNDSGCIHLPPDTLAGPTRAHPSPRIHVRAPRPHAKGHVGRTLRIAWQAHAKGGVKVQEIWFSRDSGSTFDLVVTGLGGRQRTYAWTVPAGAAADQARIRVVGWSNGLERGIGESRPFRILP